MTCPKLNIPWKKWASETNPNPEREHENYQAIERWATGILKCMPSGGGAFTPQGMWVAGFGSASIDVSAGNSSAYTPTLDSTFWVTDGYSWETGTGDWCGIQTPITEDSWFLVDLFADFDAQASSPTVGTVLGKATVQVTTATSVDGSRGGQFLQESDWLVAKSTTGTEVDGCEVNATSLLVVPAGGLICPVITVDAFTSMTGIDADNLSLKAIYLGPATNNTWFGEG